MDPTNDEKLSDLVNYGSQETIGSDKPPHWIEVTMVGTSFYSWDMKIVPKKGKSIKKHDFLVFSIVTEYDENLFLESCLFQE